MCGRLPQRLQLSGPLPRERHAASLMGGAGRASAAPRLPGHHCGCRHARHAPERHLQLPGRLPQQVGSGRSLVHSLTAHGIFLDRLAAATVWFMAPEFARYSHVL